MRHDETMGMNCSRISIFSLLLIIIFFYSCYYSHIQVIVADPHRLSMFSVNEIYKKDIQKASKVINDNNLIITLTHLQTMDKGGRKYYLLEKETLSHLLNSVTKNLYRDIYLVNWEGTIIYTMHDDSVFARNVSEIASSSLSIPYNAAMDGQLIATNCSIDAHNQCIIASPVEKDDKRWGVIMLILSNECATAALVQETSISTGK
ncbi:MAG: hypothetical protein N2316_10545 [Spirochaetes bacterium]|nr:hypothetical protein [Spirochaetota bacterium]